MPWTAKEGEERSSTERSLWDPGQVGGGRPTFLSPVTGFVPTLSPRRGLYCLMPCGGLKTTPLCFFVWGRCDLPYLGGAWKCGTPDQDPLNFLLATQNQHNRSEEALLPPLRLLQ